MGCTSFCLDVDGHLIFGTNYDHRNSKGFLFVNKRNIKKKGYIPNSSREYAEWISKYGSVTFNVGGFQYAWAGMNETGLTISTMFLEDSNPPKVKEIPPLDSGMWVQFLLDTCSSVNEVIESEQKVTNSSTVDHYLVCDRKGGCAVIEFLDGIMVSYTGLELPTRVLTNNTYEDSVKPRKNGRFQNLLHKTALFRKSSLNRFDIASAAIKNIKFEVKNSIYNSVFAILDSVSSKITQWSIVFDITSRQIQFYTKKNRKIKFFDINSFDFSGETPARMLNIHDRLSGSISKNFFIYSHFLNLDHVRRYLKKYSPLKNRNKRLSDKDIKSIVRYVESFSHRKSNYE